MNTPSIYDLLYVADVLSIAILQGVGNEKA